MKMLKIFFSASDKPGQLGDLREPECCLHVGRLHVVADMRVDVLVIVAAGQFAKLPFESLAAGIFFSGSAPAIPAPVAKRVDQYLQAGLIGQDGSTFSHGDVVSGIEADG